MSVVSISRSSHDGSGKQQNGQQLQGYNKAESVFMGIVGVADNPALKIRKIIPQNGVSRSSQRDRYFAFGMLEADASQQLVTG